MRERLAMVGWGLILLLAWELLARAGPWPPSLLPDPVAVGRSVAAMAADGRLGAAALRSLARLAQGFTLSVVLGVPLGVAMARSPRAQRSVRPLVLGLQALPSVCWLPLALIWLGASEAAVVFVVVAGSLLAVAVATEDGVAGVDPALLRAAGTLGIRGLRFHLGVLLPAALPSILTGLKLGWSFAWRALMAGELLYAAGGLGQLLDQGRKALDAAQVMGVMACIVAIGLAVDLGLFRPLEARVRSRWGLSPSA